MSQPQERPLLLSIGIVCNVIHAVLMLVFIAVAATFGLGVFGISLSESDPDVLLPLTWFAAFLGFIGAAFFFFYLALLWVCHASWQGGRSAIWMLVAFNVLGVINSGPISLAVSVITIVGALLWLDGTKR